MPDMQSQQAFAPRGGRVGNSIVMKRCGAAVFPTRTRRYPLGTMSEPEAAVAK
ncbi:hypothetical protein ACFXO7_23730 [Nocardia tengchongensis]|uniref:hypothetical protein n=1 Tax=Nocardia tengchongensis TaxID=2055889 RepID=UPI0036C5DB7E